MRGTRPFFKAEDVHPPFLTILILNLLSFILVPPQAGAVTLPAMASCRVDAAMAPDGLAKIATEEVNGTLIVKGMAWEGEARWSFPAGEAGVAPREGSQPAVNIPDAAGNVVITGKVRISGILLSRGQAGNLLDKSGILWLQYEFLSPEGANLGDGEGFMTQQKIGELRGSSSFSGTLLIEGRPVIFTGTGAGSVSTFARLMTYREKLAALEEEQKLALERLEKQRDASMEEVKAGCLADIATCGELKAKHEKAIGEQRKLILEGYLARIRNIRTELKGDSLSQDMSQTILTATRPSFEFKAAAGIHGTAPRPAGR